jgi:hypothetical protein
VRSSGEQTASKLIAAFGLVQVTLFLGAAISRVTPYAVDAWTANLLSPWQKVLFVGWATLMLYTEGYKGFHLRFCPRVVGRAIELGRRPRPLHLVLALPYCLSLFAATRKQLIARWTFIACLYSLIAVVRHLAQPWRGIVDGGVVVGLVWGVVGLWWFFGQHLAGRFQDAAAEAAEAARGDISPAT